MIRAFQWDLARQVERLDFLLAQLPRYADWGYQELYLHLEDAVEYPSLPGVARDDAYTIREFEKLVKAATRAGIKVVPIINLLGHTQYLIKHPDLRDLNELRAPDGSPLERGQICPLHPRTLEVAAKLLGDMMPFCTAGKVHVGLDESFHLGKHPLSRAEIERIGLASHFSGYVNRLHTLVQPHGLRMGMWADMLALIPEAIVDLPRGMIAYDWYYYPFPRHPRMELHNYTDYDLAPAFAKQGVEYWGCPMNGSFRYEPMPIFGDRLANVQSWWRRCRQTQAGGFLMTGWEPQRLAFELPIVVDAAAASLWLNPEIDDHAGMLAKGFERVFGKAGSREAARAALGADEHAFAGYAKWETNDRWDNVAGPEGPARAAASAKYFGRVAANGVVDERKKSGPKNSKRAGSGLPVPLVASAALNQTLAAREAFLRTAVRTVQRIRRAHATGRPRLISSQVPAALEEADAFGELLKAGLVAARVMWTRTRNPKAVSPNETILERDVARLTDWKRWLNAVAKNSVHALAAAPMHGRWQLSFIVHNHAPALQKILVEQEQPQQGQSGNTKERTTKTKKGEPIWTTLAERFTIEFQSKGARPKANVKREFSVSIDTPAKPLRIAIRGLGEVAISQVTLTDGVITLRPKDWPVKERRALGEKAPSSGFPDLHLVSNREAIELVWS